MARSKRRKWDLTRVIEGILGRRRRGRPLNYKAVVRDKEPLVGAGRRLFGSWDRALGAAGLDPSRIRLKPVARHWTRETILAAIGRESRAHRDLSVTGIVTRDGGLYLAALTRFGTWPRALRIAGLDPARIQRKASPTAWTRERVLSKIRARKRKGLPLNHAAAHDAYSDLPASGSRFFGSWDRALEAAGVDPDRVRARWIWTRDSLIRWIRAQFAAHRDLSMTGVDKTRRSALDAGRRFFGTWRAALRGARLDPDLICRTREWPTRESILDGIRNLPVILRTQAARRASGGLFHVALDRFHSWPGAVRAAGRPYPARPCPWPRERVVREIAARRREGLPLYVGAVDRERAPLVTWGRRHFGSWDAALKAAGIAPDAVRRPPRWTRERMVQTIRQQHRAGLDMRVVAVVERNSTLPTQASRRFGSWWGALRAAGLNPVELGCRRWKRRS